MSRTDQQCSCCTDFGNTDHSRGEQDYCGADGRARGQRDDLRDAGCADRGAGERDCARSGGSGEGGCPHDAVDSDGDSGAAEEPVPPPKQNVTGHRTAT
ncbi:hypothetical protein HLB23_03265 [Nocardia uniformis]|uniref:Uncharacterized protein n=1 Tax=Nocardia uniformis TaxID=53432 RepID=A0A849BS06_9NOCA|nr:hypothetical protein [Nocardia uniformis]NNH68904.1 hypothetical protein [Nocardia uniformis]